MYNEGELLTGCIARFNKLRKRRAHETREALLTEVGVAQAQTACACS